MEIVSGRTGSPHVTSQQFRQLVEGTVGQESYILTSGENLEPELASNNILKIRSGMMSHHGNISSIKIGTYDEVELTNGSQGMKRIDLVVNRYTRNAETNVEANNWVVITGTPVASDPALNTLSVCPSSSHSSSAICGANGDSSTAIVDSVSLSIPPSFLAISMSLLLCSMNAEITVFRLKLSRRVVTS